MQLNLTLNVDREKAGCSEMLAFLQQAVQHVLQHGGKLNFESAVSPRAAEKAVASDILGFPTDLISTETCGAEVVKRGQR